MHFSPQSNERQSLVRGVATASDNLRMLFGIGGGKIFVNEMETKETLHTFEKHTAEVRDISVFPGSSWVLSAGKDKTVRLWDLATGQEVKAFSGHTDIVSSVAFSPDGRRALSAGYDRQLKFWDLPSSGPPPLKELTSGPGGSSKAFQEMVGRLEGKWISNVAPFGIVRLEFQSDGRFSIGTGDKANAVSITGSWKMQGVGKDSGAVKMLPKGGAGKLLGADETVPFRLDIVNGAEVLTFRAKALMTGFIRDKK